MAQRIKDLTLSVVTAVAWVTAVVWVQSLALELLHASGAAKKKKKIEKILGCLEIFVDDNFN